MYSLNSRIAADIFDGEYVIANLDTGLYYSLQGLAVSLVGKLPFTNIEEQINVLAAHYTLNSTEVRADLELIWKQLIAEEIVKETPAIVLPNTNAFVFPALFVPSSLNRYADMQDLLLLDPIHDVDEDGWAVKQDPK